MTSFKFLTAVVVLATSAILVHAQRFPKEDLVLCDCGLGDNKDHPEWSTSRQMNWYQNITWPDSGYSYPDAPDMSVQVPYNDGIYPWIPSGATAAMPNGDVWTVYIEDGTPDGFIAGNAVSTKEGGQAYNCWAYRGRPVSAAINKTVSDDAVCWSAFVCNRDNKAPPRPKDMGSHSSSLTTSSAAPTTTYYSGGPPTGQPAPTGGDPVPPTSQPVPTQRPAPTSGEPKPSQVPTGGLFVDVFANPRFITWQDSWADFISNFTWDQRTGRCVGEPILQPGYKIKVECAGIQLDDDSHLTLLLIQALREVGLRSLWFNQNPTIPSNNGTNTTASDKWVIMPEAFSLRVTDLATKKIIGYLGYSTDYDGFITGPCTTCETRRFNKDFFDPIIAAMQGTYPYYDRYTVQGQCQPWMVCE
ncbi:hypothetical protein S40293_04270 [Stachybotrys chartarum IBT 40293]|nr:hypothetical protein S40293_04270 [Stachybotrys chartarum IBT 40293]